MGRKKQQYPYTEERGDKIRININFRQEGRLIRPTLDLEPTPKNLKYASKLAQEIRDKIKHGTFKMSDYFDVEDEKVCLTFAELAREYLASKSRLSKNTLEAYKKYLNYRFMPPLHNVEINKITYGMLSQIIKDADFQSPKTHNNAMTPVRGILKIALIDNHIKDDPTKHIPNHKWQNPPPDPLSIEEVYKILNEFKQPEWVNYFRFMFFTGCRTSEAIALGWGDIDFNKEVAHIRKAKVVGRINDHTKTYNDRYIELNSQAMKALKDQKRFSFVGGDAIFTYPNTKITISSDSPSRIAWTGVLKKARY